MQEFRKFISEDGTLCYHLVFEEDEYLVVFTKFNDGVFYSHTEYRKHTEERFLTVDERVWSLAISQALKIIVDVDAIKLDPLGGLFR